MKLSRKIFKIVGIVLFLSIILIYMFSKSYLLKSFITIEQNETKSNTERVVTAIDNDIDNMSALNLDYSIWSETYDFMKNHNQEYIISNFADISPFKNLGANFFMFVDTSGKIIYSRIITYNDPKEYIVNENDLNYIKNSVSSINKNTHSEVKGVLQLNQFPVLITGQPILKSDGSGVSRGFIITGKYIDSNEINHLSKNLKLNIEISKFNPSNGKLNNFDTNGIYTTIENNQFIFGHGLMKDVFGKPAVIVNLKIERSIYKEAINNINCFLAILISISIFFYILVLVLLDKMVLKRISRFKEIINIINETEDLTQEIAVTGMDEISELGDHFNRMFKKLNKTKLKILKLAYYDTLTGLINRKKLLENLQLMIKENKNKFAILYIDLDNFKNINDSLGHNIGDIILAKIANRFKTLEEENRFIARVGGDEFVIVQGNIIDNATAEKLAIDILNKLKPVITLNNNEHYVGASIGISIYPEDGRDVHTLIKNADVAMYAAKKKGEHGYEFYSRNMNGSSLNKLMLENALRKALKKNEFIIYYQPIQNVKEYAVIGSEALIRWKLDGKLIPPNEFIPIAKHIGEIVSIDNWVLLNACIQCKKWNTTTNKNLYISVNISFKQLKQQRFVDEVKEALEKARLEAHFLNLEITEDEAMEDAELTINTLQQLKDIGVNISLDDFGTGYSSLSYVNRLPIDTLKIDRSLIKHIHTNNKNIEIVKSTIAMAHSLNIKVIAEGIENIEQLNVLAELNCDAIQGFYFGRPMEAIEFEEKFM